MPHPNKEKPRHPLLVELGLASPPTKNADGKRNREKTQPQRPIGALDILQQLLETNLVTGDQLRDAYAVLSQTRGEHEAKEEREHTTPKNKPPDYRTRHIALRIYYEGKNYSGLAENVGQEGDESIERHIFAALEKTQMIVSRETSHYSRCGRTDKGVSAVGQVIALHLKSAIPLDASWDEAGERLIGKDDEAKLPQNGIDTVRVWVPPKANKKAKKQPSTQPATAPRQAKELSEYSYEKILNRLLPPDIRVLGWCPVSNDFSARFSAKDRTYRYFFIRRNLNLEAMKEGLKLLEGRHDFRNLCKLNVVEVSNFERTIYKAELLVGMPLYDCNGPCDGHTDPSQDDSVVLGLCYFQIQGQAFLWHQIRCIVSVLFMIGRGLEEPSVMTELLNVEKYPGKPSYSLAEEFPLVLHDCGYDNLQLGYSVQNLWSVTSQLESQWEQLVLEAARVRNCLHTLQQQTVSRQDLVEFGRSKLTDRIKKSQRSHNKNAVSSSSRQDQWAQSLANIDQQRGENGEKTSQCTWAEALQWLEMHDMIQDGNALQDHVHIPLLSRSKGTTLEEKLESLQQNSNRRSQRYEENAAKKQKSEGQDAAFYEHKLKQGNAAS